jgi:uncharacterized protein
MDAGTFDIVFAAVAGLACGFLNTVASSGSAVSLPILMGIGLDPLTANATNRLPVLVGAVSATGSFQRRGVVPWRLAAKACIPVTIGAAAGAVIAEFVPARDLALLITAAVLFALIMLFTKVKSAIASAEVHEPRYGAREILMLLGIGIWLGFIVLDGATYLLLALTLAVGLPIAGANAVKSVILIPTSLIAVLIFAADGDIDWEVGVILALGSIVGGLLGARLASSEAAKVWVYRILVLVIVGELAHLALHYVFDIA